MKYTCVHVGHFSRHLAAEDSGASGGTSGWCALGRAMLPVRFCNMWISVKYSTMLHVAHGKQQLWSDRILVQNHISHLVLWHKRENASFAIIYGQLYCNAAWEPAGQKLASPWAAWNLGSCPDPNCGEVINSKWYISVHHSDTFDCNENSDLSFR